MNITIGEVLTIAVMILGFLLQYIAIVVKFSERITRLETHKDHMEKEMQSKHDEIEKNLKFHVDTIFNNIRECRSQHEKES